MASLAKVKVTYGAKMRRQSAPPPPPPPPPPPLISIDRTGLKIQEIPPELCHLTGDALATPFPPIALGGYVRYYRAHPEHLESFGTVDIWEKGRAKLDFVAKESMQDAKKRRRASSASMLFGPLLSHLPKPSPSDETPPRSNLFHIRTSSSPESTPSPVSPGPPPPIPPRSKRRPILSIIHEGSRETMRSEIGESISLPTTPRKTRVISYPSILSTPTKSSLSTSALTLSLAVSPPPERSSSPGSPAKSNSVHANGSVSLSPSGSLRRKKRRVLRTPSVENDFARSAKELFGFGRKVIGAGRISRENSIGSEATEEDTILSPAMSVSTALTSLLDTLSISSSPSSPTKSGEHNRLTSSDNRGHLPDSATSTTPPRCSPELGPKNDSSAPSDHNSDSDATSSPIISTPSTTFAGGGLLDDAELLRFVLLDFDEDEDEEGSRDSWASYATAKSYLEPSLPIVLEADERPVEVGMRETESIVVAA